MRWPTWRRHLVEGGLILGACDCSESYHFAAANFPAISRFRALRIFLPAESSMQVLVIGAGVVGLAVARAGRARRP